MNVLYIGKHTDEKVVCHAKYIDKIMGKNGKWRYIYARPAGSIGSRANKMIATSKNALRSGANKTSRAIGIQQRRQMKNASKVSNASYKAFINNPTSSNSLRSKRKVNNMLSAQKSYRNTPLGKAENAKENARVYGSIAADKIKDKSKNAMKTAKRKARISLAKASYAAEKVNKAANNAAGLAKDKSKYAMNTAKQKTQLALDKASKINKKQLTVNTSAIKKSVSSKIHEAKANKNVLVNKASRKVGIAQRQELKIAENNRQSMKTFVDGNGMYRAKDAKNRTITVKNADGSTSEKMYKATSFRKASQNVDRAQRQYNKTPLGKLENAIQPKQKNNSQSNSQNKTEKKKVALTKKQRQEQAAMDILNNTDKYTDEFMKKHKK